ncbi:MAG: glutathione S-transferase family protein [Deltaproteobacteria bacterium]|nr:glutathione S-transferase family protein [Deltaproteobacteria bacterium]
MLVKGKWKTDWYKADDKGRFVRPETVFRSQVTADGSSGFKAEAGRYHLYVSLACPWAHRTLIMRKLKKLENSISLSIVDPFMGDDGWAFSTAEGCIPDSVNGCAFLREVYVKADPKYTGRVTVPILWDKETKSIVNNESRRIMRMLDTEFDAIGDGSINFCPAPLQEKIDETIEAIYMPINNGVYRAGFAATQEAYDEAAEELFSALDYWDDVLSGSRYLCGHAITEADWCMFTTLIRFDPVYYTHFKCNLRHIYEYENLWNYLKELYRMPGIEETCNFRHIKAHYYLSHRHINPSGIIPAGPKIDLTTGHDRNRFD